MFLRTLVALLCACLAAAPALAQDSGFYASAEASYYAIQLPDYAPMALSTGFMEYRDTRKVHDGFVDGPLGQLTLGWKTESGVFFEARGFTASPESTEDHTLSLPAGVAGSGMFRLNGGGSTMFGSGTATSTKLEMDQYGGELLAGYEIPISESLSLSPFAGYYFLELDQTYTERAALLVAPAMAFNRREELDTTYHGLEAGARLDYHGESVRARLAGTLGWAYARSGYRGQDWGFIDDSLSLNHSDWGALARLEGGVDLPLGAWTLGLDAGVEYLSYVPGIRASEALVPTSIRSCDSVSGKVGLNLGYAF